VRVEDGGDGPDPARRQDAQQPFDVVRVNQVVGFPPEPPRQTEREEWVEKQELPVARARRRLGIERDVGGALDPKGRILDGVAEMIGVDVDFVTATGEFFRDAKDPDRRATRRRKRAGCDRGDSVACVHALSANLHPVCEVGDARTLATLEPLKIGYLVANHPSRIAETESFRISCVK